VFRPVTNNRTGDLDRPLDTNSVYRNIVQKYGLAGCGRRSFVANDARWHQAPCIKDGFLPTSSLPLGEIREREQAVKILFQQPASCP
jgi:hypothetical protein